MILLDIKHLLYVCWSLYNYDITMETWRAECGCWGDNSSYQIQMGAETPGAATRPGEAQAFVGQKSK